MATTERDTDATDPRIPSSAASESDPPAPTSPGAGDAAAGPAPTRKRIPLDAFGTAGVPNGLTNSSGIVWRILVLIVGLLVVIAILGMVGGVATAIFASMIVAALGAPAQRFLARVMPNALATVLTLLLLVLGVVIVFTFVIKSIVNEWSALLQAANDGIKQLDNWARTGPLHLDDSTINELLTKAQTWAGTEGTSLAKNIPGTLGSLGDFITAASVAIFGSFFFLNSRGSIWQWAMSWIPERVRTEVDDCGHVAWVALSGYTRGIIGVAVADGLLVFIGLVILHVPLAAALAVVVMFGALIPVIGAPIATMFAAVVALATEGLTTALAVIVLTVIVGSFDGDIMQPLIMGHAVQLHPLAIVSVIAVGTLSFGITGALVAVPITATVYSVAKYLSGRTPPPRELPPRRVLPRLPGFLRRGKSDVTATAA